LKTEHDITNTVERFKQAVQQAAWNATPTNSNSEIHIEFSPAMQEKIAKKKKILLRKMWQVNRCPVLKNKLNCAIKALKKPAIRGQKSGDTSIFK